MSNRGSRRSMCSAKSGEVLRRTLAVVAGAAVVASLATLASADVVHTGCNAVGVGATSGWCRLYPGNATDNVRELGQVSINAAGTSMTVQTADASTGVVPATAFACLLFTPASQVTHRLQGQQCAAAEGVWFPMAGGSTTIDLTAYPQFLHAQVTVQVAANRDANNANGDAFYNNIDANTVTTGGTFPG